MPGSHVSFSERLHVALDLAGVTAGRSRVRKLAEMYSVSRETTRKWLTGMALPETERLIDMATRFGVGFEWLMTGRGVQGMPTSGKDNSTSVLINDQEQIQLLSLIRRLPRHQRRGLRGLLESMLEPE